MTTPREVLDLQIDLAERLESPSLNLSRYVDMLVSERDQGGTPVSSRLYEFLVSGRTYRVSAEMVDEIAYRAWEDDTHLPAHATYGQYPPPRHRGFAYLDAPLKGSDIRGTSQFIRAVSWGYGMQDSGERGWMIALLGDLHRETDGQLDQLFDPMSHDGTARSLRRLAGEPDAPLSEVWTKLYGRWAPVAVFFISRDDVLGDPWYDVSEDMTRHFVERLKSRGQSRKNLSRLLLDRAPSIPRSLAALWQLLSEERSVAEPTTPTREMKTSTGRSGPRPEVNVVTLRRPSRRTQRPGTGTKRTTRCWVEGGFTRTYWVGPKGQQRPVTRTIGGYWSVKDESLPIKNRPTVHDLRR